MLFVRMCSLWWNKPEHSLHKWGLQEEFHRPFLGIVAKLWNMLIPIQRERWKYLARDEFSHRLMKYTSKESLVHEIYDHVSTVLGLTLIRGYDEEQARELIEQNVGTLSPQEQHHINELTLAWLHDRVGDAEGYQDHIDASQGKRTESA